MSKMTEWIDQNIYPDFSKNWDDILFRERILSQVNLNSTVLDLGAGAGIVSQMNFKGRVQRICGVDLDPRVVDNPFLDEGRVSDAGKIPYDDHQFDLVFCDNVLEHIEHPLSVFRDVARVLKSGGIFTFKTPNKWHYMPTIARLTPHKFHQFINKIRGRAEVDTFPTLYRANTRRKLHRLAADSGFFVESIELIEGRPEYLRMTGLTYIAGATYERIVNSSSIFESFRIILIGTCRKI